MQECPTCHSVILYPDNYCQFCGSDIRGLYAEGDWSHTNTHKEFKQSSTELGTETKKIIRDLPLVWASIVFLYIIICSIILASI